MKILIPVIAMGSGGGNRVLAKIADELIDLGHQVEFLCPDNSKPPYFKSKALVNWANRSGELSQQYHNRPYKIDNFFTIQKKLTRALRKIDKAAYDIIIANQSFTIFPILRAGLKSKTLYYVQAYEPDMYALMGGIKNFIFSTLSSLTYRTNCFTVVNADIYRTYKLLSSDRVLYPGVDYSLFYPKQSNLTIQSNSKTDKIIIGTIGRLEVFKGTFYVLQAFVEIKKKYPNAELHVAFGQPQDFEKYKDVYCVQPHGDDALADFYRSLDYYICAGFTQIGAFHYPVVEAMCCGVPVITTLYYPATDDNAWLIRLKSAEDIADKFETAHSDLSIRQNKIKRAIIDTQQFDWKKAGKKLEGFLIELAAKKSSN